MAENAHSAQTETQDVDKEQHFGSRFDEVILLQVTKQDYKSN